MDMEELMLNRIDHWLDQPVKSKLVQNKLVGRIVEAANRIPFWVYAVAGLLTGKFIVRYFM